VPLYEYRCKKCGHTFEKIQKFSDPLVTDCPSCKAKKTVEQLMSRSAVQFKGSGWYATDYAKKPTSAPSKTGDSKTEVKAESGSDSKKTETKTESKSETKSPSTEKKKN
jgi:putative FmdB family regulatory protein